VAYQKADVEMYVISGVFRLLSMAVQILGSSDMAGACHRRREALLGSLGAVREDDVASACDAMVTEAWAIRTLLEMLEQRKSIGEKVPEKLKNGASW
jgi:hypothetical protein